MSFLFLFVDVNAAYIEITAPFIDISAAYIDVSVSCTDVCGPLINETPLFAGRHTDVVRHYEFLQHHYLCSERRTVFISTGSFMSVVRITNGHISAQRAASNQFETMFYI